MDPHFAMITIVKTIIHSFSECESFTRKGHN
jgi:hypothetical protein